MIPTPTGYPEYPMSNPSIQSASQTPSSSQLASAHSPALSTTSKRKHSHVEAEAAQNNGAKKKKDKGKAKDDSDNDENAEGGGGDNDSKKKRNRMALSCKECKRRKIKCDRQMPVCTHCAKRGRPSDCQWDVFQPANDAFLPPTIARTSEVENLAARLAHVEAYLKTLPPNFALFRPHVPLSGGSNTPTDPAPRPSATKAEKDAEEGYSDTEDAATILENGVFESNASKAPFTSNAMASNSNPPNTNRPNLPHAPTSYAAGGARPQRFGVPTQELTPALTSIISSFSTPSALYFTSTALRVHLNLDFDTSPATAHEAFRSEIDRMIRSLPGREATAHLVDRYFTSVAWLFRVVHAPSLRAEVEAFNKLCDEGRQAEVDIYWLALLFMVLCLAVDSTHFSRSPLALDSTRAHSASGTPVASHTDPNPLSVYTTAQLEALPERWYGIAMRLMRLGEWESFPRIRSIQTIILFTQYLQLSSSSRGQPSQLVIWLAGAIRLAQVLNLHLLGSNPDIMPPDDPAFPPGRNSIKREMAKRLWSVLVYQDWLGANSRSRCYLIDPMHFDTDDPLNLNDSDLSPSQPTSQSAPSTVLTDSTADRVRIATARQVRAVFDRVVLAHDSTIETIQDLDKGFREILEGLPEGWTLAADEQEPPMVKFQRHFVLEGLHNRIFRLHRPLLSKASRNPKYRFSAEACLKSARAVVVSTHNIREAVVDVPYTFSHCLGASLVLFNDLFQAIDHDLSAPEIDSKIDTLQLALEIFSSKPTSPSLGAVVQQGHRILSGLFREEERRRTTRAARALSTMLASTGRVEDANGTGQDDEETETFAEVLQRIARNLNSDSAPHRGTPPPTRNIPSKASTARFTSATYPPSLPSTLPPFDEMSVPLESTLSNVSAPLSSTDAVPVSGFDPSGYDYTNDSSTWPFPRPNSNVDSLSLQFFHELDVGLPLPHLDYGIGGGQNMDGANLVADAASYWGSGSRAAEFAASAGGGIEGEFPMQESGPSSTWSGQQQNQPEAGPWSLGNIGMGGW